LREEEGLDPPPNPKGTLFPGTLDVLSRALSLWFFPPTKGIAVVGEQWDTRILSSVFDGFHFLFNSL